MMTPGEAGNPKLLSGGNPQIPKGDGDGPVQAYIDAMPGWKQAIGRAIDRIVERELPDVKKAVKWNTPFYGPDGTHWYLSVHCFTNFVRVTFFNGSRLSPPPEKTSKYPDVRYYDVPEDGLDEDQFADWVRQASHLPGEKL
ncbi:DUF1801 domain-containing protein [Hyphobacterium sp. Y6023]|uniref:DUF1801 domain-containing protein n=2 Tax=Hyphobacterium marinum TaxID=3116574 RepID=A0ABU7LYE9_9PROT|nr:DUF1801 domain-containing protein [Hyphobacterium sp. Y6023]MEE2566215.1 DUF1801 domain-containing protein [Hyphobacterium sp. Y6023]